jgi:HlyD family secretion protein
MKKRLFILTGTVALAVLTASLIWGRATVSKRPVAVVGAPSKDWVISGPGKVEPGSENIKLAAELNGKVKRILVEEGDTISAGQVLAELQNSDYQAQVESAQAEVKQREAELRKVINGARSEERRQAMSTVREA